MHIHGLVAVFWSIVLALEKRKKHPCPMTTNQRIKDKIWSEAKTSRVSNITFL